MNKPRSPAHVRISTQDPVLRSKIVERLADLGDIVIVEEDEAPDATTGNGTGPSEASVETPAAGTSLTPRETEVLRLLSEGLANKEIAARLEFSTHTAKFHVESILRKLGAVNRAEAVMEGIRQGLLGL
jgi:DNA-binding CsgD family transcriptional regulator